ncbi:hypothetical protein ZHAS_00020429 [Anopheles sinensis]|uniref:Uncharacterized protein n=1 Tax=Anopheles sinensis TaxID=74873 RepID=A0A084WPG8_ANOSI|nr:hypothetical protein ZHAS_00020429 [Anopheles sinensis]
MSLLPSSGRGPVARTWAPRTRGVRHRPLVIDGGRVVAIRCEINLPHTFSPAPIRRPSPCQPQRPTAKLIFNQHAYEEGEKKGLPRQSSPDEQRN